MKIVIFTLAFSIFCCGASIEAREDFREAKETEQISDSNDVRDYFLPMTESEKNDIRYIIMTLATKSSFSLLFEKKSLNDAGNRVAQVHPLKFLLYVFSDPQLRHAVVKIKGIPWNRFVKDMGESLAIESQKNNITQEQVKDFAKKATIRENVLTPLISSGRWEDFINASRNNLG